MTPDDPRHGTNAGALAHRRAGQPICDACREGRRVAQKRMAVDRQRGRPRTINPELVARHIERLRSTGMGYMHIAKAAGVSPGTIYRAVGSPQGKSARMQRRIAARILAVKPTDLANNGYVDKTGTVRRIQALVAIGWPIKYLAERLGKTAPNLSNLLHDYGGRPDRAGRWVTAATHAKAVALYDELHMKPGHSAGARRRAERFGWLPPLAWDDIDDISEKPQTAAPTRSGRNDIDEAVVLRLLAGDTVPSNKAEKDEAMRRWIAAGHSAKAFGRMHGWDKPERYGKDAA